MNRIKNNETYILGEFMLGVKFANIRERDLPGQRGWWPPDAANVALRTVLTKHLVGVTWAQLILSWALGMDYTDLTRPFQPCDFISEVECIHIYNIQTISFAPDCKNICLYHESFMTSEEFWMH